MQVNCIQIADLKPEKFPAHSSHDEQFPGQ